MVAAQGWLSPTRITGITSYSVCFLACVVRWRFERKCSPRSGIFALLAVTQFCLLLDMVFNWRWRLHDFWMREAMNLGAYEQRRGPQAVAIGILTVASALGGIWIMRRFRGRLGAAIALTGTMLSVALWCCECVSFHWADQLFYHLVGRVMMISLLWVGLALITCLGIWLEGKGHLSAEPRG